MAFSMTDKAALLDLADRVERAEGPDPKLDAFIGQALGYPGWEPFPVCTASVDAVLALIAEKLPGWTAVRFQSRRAKTLWRAELSKLSAGLGSDEDVISTNAGKTPALALLTVCLRALAQSEAETKTGEA